MYKAKFLLILILGASGIIFYSGCSSSSNSIRYDQKSQQDKSNSKNVRFTSANDPGTIKDTASFSNEPTYNDSDDIPDDKGVDISKVMSRFSTEDRKSDLSADVSSLREKMLMEIIKYLNTPYKYGGTTKNGIDCSAFTQTIFEKTFSYHIERTARQQFKEGIPIDSINKLKFGDLVFFNTRRRVKPGHVGIYIGDRLFAHSSSSHGVTVSTLDHNYFSRRFMGGRRIEDLFSTHTASQNP